MLWLLNHVELTSCMVLMKDNMYKLIADTKLLSILARRVMDNLNTTQDTAHPNPGVTAQQQHSNRVAMVNTRLLQTLNCCRIVHPLNSCRPLQPEALAKRCYSAQTESNINHNMRIGKQISYHYHHLYYAKPVGTTQNKPRVLGY